MDIVVARIVHLNIRSNSSNEMDNYYLAFYPEDKKDFFQFMKEVKKAKKDSIFEFNKGNFLIKQAQINMISCFVFERELEYNQQEILVYNSTDIGL